MGGAFLTEDYDLKAFVYDNSMIDEAKSQGWKWYDEASDQMAEYKVKGWVNA